MKLYKGEKTCNCDMSQLTLMEKAGWSRKPQETEKAEVAPKVAPTQAAPTQVAPKSK
jgi:hypothetical protein